MDYKYVIKIYEELKEIHIKDITEDLACLMYLMDKHNYEYDFKKLIASSLFEGKPLEQEEQQEILKNATKVAEKEYGLNSH